MRGHRGWMHVVYDHRWRPSQIDVVCPGCGALAQARDPHHGTNVNPHVEFFDKPAFRVACTRCPFCASSVRFGELPTLYHLISARGHVLWAWNTDHLQMLLRALQQGDGVGGRPTTGLYSQYIRREWKQHREAFAKAILRHMKHPAPRPRHPLARERQSALPPVVRRAQRQALWAQVRVVPPEEGGGRASIRSKLFHCQFWIGANSCDAVVHLPKALFAGDARKVCIELTNARQVDWRLQRDGTFELRENGRIAARGTVL